MPYGNPILPPSNSQTCEPIIGKHGTLQVRALPDADTFALFYKPNPDGETVRDWTMLASHPNGHSCKALADRIVLAWEGKGDGIRALEQFDFILRCGGTGRDLETAISVIQGRY